LKKVSYTKNYPFTTIPHPYKKYKEKIVSSVFK
jgi:hypothetical protein